MTRQWYSFYPGDYARDTGHLSLMEHGAYRALMDHYYATELPLPNAVDRLIRLCRAYTPDEEAAVRRVLADFFVAGEDGFRHPRIDEELTKAVEQSVRASAAAKIMHQRRKQVLPPCSVPADAESLPPQPPPQPQPQGKNNISPPQKGNSDTDGFDEFWNAFPRREARATAQRAYAKALESASPQTLVAGARSYAARREGQDTNFTKLPANWLSRECWLDDKVAAKTGPPSDEAALGALWNGCAARLIGEIGAAQFKAYFGNARFDAGPPPRIGLKGAFLRDLVERKCSGALGRALGEFVLEVAA
jgi:uncharacterized protein YdaU (DUF1376 family)